MPAIHEMVCKSILNPSRIPGIDYTVNPYTGCLHGCVYCYARFMAKYTPHRSEWGSFCDVKINAVERLEKEILKRPKGLVSLSTVTDPYQLPEKKYQLTRNILMLLAEHRFPTSVLTKSDLVLRDIDILKRFDRESLDVGFSINSMDEAVRREFEPGAPPVIRRIEALKTLHGRGIRTWIFIAPILPILSEQSIFRLLDGVGKSIDEILIDTLNVRSGNWARISGLLTSLYPQFLETWKRLLFSVQEREEYYGRLFERIKTCCEAKGIVLRIC